MRKGNITYRGFNSNDVSEAQAYLKVLDEVNGKDLTRFNAWGKGVLAQKDPSEWMEMNKTREGMGRRTFLALCDQAIIGFASVVPNSELSCYEVYTLGVREEYRKQRVGHLLLGLVEDHVKIHSIIHFPDIQTGIPLGLDVNRITRMNTEGVLSFQQSQQNSYIRNMVLKKNARILFKV